MFTAVGNVSNLQGHACAESRGTSWAWTKGIICSQFPVKIDYLPCRLAIKLINVLQIPEVLSILWYCGFRQTECLESNDKKLNNTI